MKEKRVIAFDQHLVKKDSTEAFIQFYCRKKYLKRLCRKKLFLSVAYRLGLMSSYRFHRILLQDVMRGMSKDKFERVAGEFAATHLDHHIHMPRVHEVTEWIGQGVDIVVQSRGMAEWVKPWCEKFGIHSVEAGQAECDANGILTGRILEPVTLQ